MWSRFVPSDRLSGCGPAQERQGGKATHLQKTDPHASGRGEHTRGTQTKHKQKQFKDQPQHVLMYLLFPYSTSPRGSTRASRSSGLMLGSLFTTQPFCTEVRRMNHSHECDLRNRLCTSLKCQLDQFHILCQQSTAIRLKLQDFSTTTHATRSDRANSWNFKLV